MYQIDELFDKRSVVGTKLEQLLAAKGYTKAKLCKESGISRPTLDKLLSGSLTSKTNYEKHISKVLECLAVTPDILLGKAQNVYNRARAIRTTMRMTSEEIGETTGISLERLREIESGAQATLAELRDIALCLRTSVRSLLGTNYFGTQIAAMQDYRAAVPRPGDDALSGFWGHIGICPVHTDQCLWFPVTRETRGAVRRMMEQDRIVVPCMNNRVLLLNMRNIKEVLFADEVCDQPAFVAWNDSVDNGGIPLVAYEVMEELALRGGIGEEADGVSSFFQGVLQELFAEKGWGEDTVWDLTAFSTIHFKDGTTQYVDLAFDGEDGISGEVSALYDFGESAFDEQALFCRDSGGIELMLKMDNIALLDLPLLKLEDAICESLKELLE